MVFDFPAEIHVVTPKIQFKPIACTTTSRFYVSIHKTFF